LLGQSAWILATAKGREDPLDLLINLELVVTAPQERPLPKVTAPNSSGVISKPSPIPR
jgi:hypothetical protein